MNKEIEQHYRKNYKASVNRVRGRMGQNHHLAEEAVQEAYVRAMSYYSCCHTDFNSWFRTVLNNAVKDTMRAERNRGLSLDEIENMPGDFDLDYELIRRKLDKYITKQQNPLTKQVLDLYFNKTLGYSGIVQITECPSEVAARKIVSRFKQEVVKDLQ